MQVALKENPLLKEEIEKLKKENDNLRKQINPSFHELMLKEDEAQPYAWLKSLPDNEDSAKQIETAFMFDRISYRLLEMCSFEGSALKLPVAERWKNGQRKIEYREMSKKWRAAYLANKKMDDQKIELETEINSHTGKIEKLRKAESELNAKKDAIHTIEVFQNYIIDLVRKQNVMRYHKWEQTGLLEELSEAYQTLGFRENIGGKSKVPVPQ